MKLLGDLAADWPQLNRLLDEALALPAADRGPWLESLPAEHASLKDTLARLLEVRAGIETGDFLGTLPKLDGALAPMAGTPDAGAPQSGDEVGPYRLVRELGEGGMGSVWLAERADGQLKRPVALKLPRLTWARGLAERMARERDILATLEHPHIARLYDAGVDKLGRPWLALEVVQGRPIDLYAKDKGLTVRQRVELLLQVCEAVAYAHSRLVIHRDLKPGNILVTDEGQVRLLDFGIAKLVQQDGGAAAATALTEIAGRALTLRYASPEQVRGEPLTTASDVYSLGVVAYELLANAAPYRALHGHAAELQAAIEKGDLPPASAMATELSLQHALRGDLDAVLAKALARQPELRYAGVGVLAQDLLRFLQGEPVLARPARAVGRLLRPLRRQRVPLLISASAALALAFGLGLGATSLVVLVAAVGATAALLQARRAADRSALAEAATRRAELVRDALLELFAPGGRPEDGRGAHELTLKEALDRARDRVPAALEQAPRDQAVVLEALAAVYEQLDLAPENFALLERAVHALDRLAPLDAPLRRRRLQLLKRRLGAAFLHQRFEGFERAMGEFESMLEADREAPGDARAAAIYFRVRFGQMRRAADPVQAAERLAEAEALFARDSPADPTRQHALALAVQAMVAVGRLDEAERFAGTGLELARRAPDSPASLGNAFSVRGVVRLRAGRWAAARSDLEAAHADYVRHSGPEHVLTAQNEVFLGHALVGCGEVEAGLATSRRAAATISRLRAGQPKEAQTLERLAAAELLADDATAAQATLRRALDLWCAHPELDAVHRVEALALLTRALARTGLATDAAATLAELDAVLGAEVRPASRLVRLRAEAAAAVAAGDTGGAKALPPGPSAVGWR